MRKSRKDGLDVHFKSDDRRVIVEFFFIDFFIKGNISDLVQLVKLFNIFSYSLHKLFRHLLW